MIKKKRPKLSSITFILNILSSFIIDADSDSVFLLPVNVFLLFNENPICLFLLSFCPLPPLAITVYLYSTDTTTTTTTLQKALRHSSHVRLSFYFFHFIKSCLLVLFRGGGDFPLLYDLLSHHSILKSRFLFLFSSSLHFFHSLILFFIFVTLSLPQSSSSLGDWSMNTNLLHTMLQLKGFGARFSCLTGNYAIWIGLFSPTNLESRLIQTKKKSSESID